MMHAYEKLGAFYLGREHDLATNETTSNTVLYDSKDLLTHAVCVGMTGSGKTGLCVGLLEEAAIDGIPALVIDPKGDLANLLLTFPGLDAASFRPWINEEEARRKGQTPDAYAQDQATLWKNGLAGWDQDGDRIARLKAAADFTVFTPGSDAGVPLSILSSFDAPPAELASDSDLLAERASTLVTSLLALLGIDADPLRSREHILITTILQRQWQDGKGVDLGGLIQLIQAPPVTRIGVLELESFYPGKERFELAMLLNNLLASPRFQTWLTGEPIDIDRLLYTDTGKPRISIFSIAHLDDAERMFFVSLLLNQTISWMRSRPGTTSLRALVYMDEIFGYIPPVANPPSKKPFLTMLKQARAYGVGVVLATQNPVDLDYKGLSNTGTWFIGRLQTERDKNRMIDGLTSIGDGSLSPQELEEIINGLCKRVFFMHNVHENKPVTFHTRWVMSYLAGPMTRHQIKMLTELQGKGESAPKGATRAGTTATSPSTRPVLGPDVPHGYVIPRHMPSSGSLCYTPAVLAVAQVHYNQRGEGIVHSEQVGMLASLPERAKRLDWKTAEQVRLTADDIAGVPTTPAEFENLPPTASSPKSYHDWQKQFADAMYRERQIDMFKSKTFKMSSKPGESERDFRIRLAGVAREMRDEQVEKLREKYAARFERIDDRIRRAEQAVEREADQAKGAKMQTAVSLGATLLSAFLGRKATSRSTLGRATTTVRGMDRASRQAGDVRRARDSLQSLLAKREELNRRFEDEIDELEDRFDPEMEEFTTTALKPRRTDIEVERFMLAWLPQERTATGGLTPLWR